MKERLYVIATKGKGNLIRREIMKKKYYVRNDNDELVLVRTSANDYEYALVDMKDINDGKKGIYACSKSYDRLVSEYNYHKNRHIQNANWCKEHIAIYPYLEEKEKISIELAQNLKIVKLESR